MSAPYAWPENVCVLTDQIAEKHGIEWDTDANINVLTSFIEEHCDPSEFIAHAEKCAVYDAKVQNGEIERLRVVIEVSGGVAEATQIPDGVEVEIIDRDNQEAEMEDRAIDPIDQAADALLAMQLKSKGTQHND